MRIAMIYTILGLGGGTHQLLRLAKSLSAKHEITIFVRKDETGKQFSELKSGIEIIELDARIPKFGNNKFSLVLQNLLHSYYCSRLISQYEFDLINPHEFPSQMTAAFVKLRKKRPIVWMCNDVWHIPGFEAKPERRKLFWLFNKTLGWWIDFGLTQTVDSIMVLDHRIQKIIKENYRKPSSVIRSGIDLAWAKGKEKNRNNNNFTFLCFSIYFPHRRFEDAVLAFKQIHDRFPNTRLRIVGSPAYSPDYFSEIENLIQKQGLSSGVSLVGKAQTESQVRGEMSACDVFIFPNERQTWGLAVIEAMSLGKPCIVSNGSGVHEIVKPGINGLVFPARDVSALAEAMEKLYKNKTLRTKIGRQAKLWVESHLSWTQYSNQMLKTFRSVTKRRL